MRIKLIILGLLSIIMLSRHKAFGQYDYWERFNHCTTAASLTCGLNTFNLPIVVPGPIIPGGNYPVHFYLNVTTPITTSMSFFGTTMNPYSVVISQPITTSIGPYCASNSNGSPPSPLYSFSGPGTSAINTPVVTLLPGLYMIYTRWYYSGPATAQPFYTFNVRLNCRTCPKAFGANYTVNPCVPTANMNCSNSCKNIDGRLFVRGTGPVNGVNISYNVSMNFGDGSPVQNYTGGPTGIGFFHNYSNGTYTVTATLNGTEGCPASTYTFVVNIVCTPPPCSDCISSFAPIPDSTYIISAWVKEANATVNTTTYSNAKIKVSFYTALTSMPGSTPVGTPVVASPSGLIIDGWQKIEQKFKIPATAAALKLDLNANGADANFDDIRVFPFNSSMKSYVYDPKTMRLMAELDERNYATFYEYDEEGKLIRVKKETEKGVMTIKESRNSSPIK